ncbi:spidroin-1-like [Ixodes scapularis]|uniref:spidroin-1-like n=1 Tax=Ixodes scapularis TaxID=6945 RepID=UPI001A9EA368|nr:spidroin-1-like [Ixodes scapularis]
MPFSFGYDTVDEYGTRLFHQEQSDANNARTGSYGYMDANGIYRRVNYVADANGFRTTIETNEPGTQAGRSADAIFNARPVAAGTRFGAPGGFGASAANGRGGLARSGSSQHGSSVSANSVYNQAAAGRPGYKQGGYGKAGYGQAGIVQAGIVQAGNVEAGIARAGYGQTGHSQSENGRTGYSQSGSGQGRYSKDGYIHDGNSQAVYDRTRYDPQRSAYHAKSQAGFASRY